MKHVNSNLLFGDFALS